MAAASMDGPQRQLQPDQGNRPVGILTNFDGNYSTNYDMVKNVRTIDHIHYGEEGEPCPGCPGECD